MKKGILVLGLAISMVASPVLALRNYEEPKDKFVLFGGWLYGNAVTVVQSVHSAKPARVQTSTPRPAITTLVKWNIAKASQYGGSDGFYYNHFACGGIYYPTVVGVANRTLRCGTMVDFKYYGTKRINGRSVKGWYTATIKVVDRGPYCCGRSFDFTVKAAQALGFNGIGTVYWKVASR